MFQRTLLGFCLLILLIVTAPISAQDDLADAWQAIIFEWDGTVTVIGTEGITHEVVIEEYFEGFGGYDWTSEVAISENAEVMAFALRRFVVAGDDRVVIADLVNDTCCTILPVPSENADFRSDITINPEGTILVTGYYELDEIPEGSTLVRGDIISSTIIAYDLTTNPPTILSTLEMEAVGVDGETFDNIHFGRWQGDFIEISPYAFRQRPNDYVYMQWNPADKTLIDTPLTGNRDGVIYDDDEIIFPELNGIFPVGKIDNSSSQRVYNVVNYSSSISDEAYVIYNDDDLLFTQAIVGMNGDAILIPIAYTSDVFVLYRDGTSIRLSVDANDLYVWHGTPDGWIVELNRFLEDENPQLVYLTVEDGQLMITPIIDELSGGSATFLIHPPEMNYTFETVFPPFDEN